MANAAREIIPVPGVAGYRGERRFDALPDPALGAPQIPAHVRAKAVDAINREVRRLKVRLYLVKAQLEVRAFFLKTALSVTEAIGNLDGYLSELRAKIGHAGSPSTRSEE